MLTLEQSLLGLYDAAAAQGAWLLGASVVIPLLGTLAAWIGRGGRTDQDGRAIANGLLLTAMSVFILGLLAATVWIAILDRSLLQLSWQLVLGPPLWFGLTLASVHRVFDLRELRAGQLLRDAGLLLALVAAVLWFFAQFRGWGVVFLGGISQLILIIAAIIWYGRRLLERLRSPPR